MSSKLKKLAPWHASVCLLFFANSFALGQNTDQKKLEQLDRQATQRLEKLAPQLRERLEKQVKAEELESNPVDHGFDHIRSLCLLLSDYGSNKQTAKAEATYKKILDLLNADHSPDDRSKANLMLYLGQACSDWGKPEYSEAAYRKGFAIVQIYEGDRKDKSLQAQFLTSLGEACLEEKKYDEAQRYFQQAYDYKHNFVGERFLVVGARLAETYRCKKNYLESERLFKEALTSFPYDSYTQKHYAQLLVDMGRTKDAQDINDQAKTENQKHLAESATLKILLQKMIETPLPTKAQQDATNKKFAEKEAALNSAFRSYWSRDSSIYRPSSIKGTSRTMPQWYPPYNADFRRQIQRAWFPPNITMPSQIVILFIINKNGTLENLGLLKSSGNQELDDSCKRAIKNARFRTLPSGAPNKMRFQITFSFAGRGSFLDLVWID